MIHGVLPSCRNDAKNKRPSDSSNASEKQSLYLNWGCSTVTHLLKVLQRQLDGPLLDQYWQTLSFNSFHSDPDSIEVLGMMSVFLVMDVWWSAGSILTLIAQDDSCCPAEKCSPPTYDGSSWAYTRLSREKNWSRDHPIGRFSPLIKWSADRDNLVLSAASSLHSDRESFVQRLLARQGECQDICVTLVDCWIKSLCKQDSAVSLAKAGCVKLSI